MKLLKFLTVFVLVLSGVLSQEGVLAAEPSINDAYKMIPHRQTPFDAKQSRLAEDDSKYLDHFFFSSDLAMRARVLMLQKLYHGKGYITIEEYNRQIEDIFTGFGFIETPPHLKQAESMLVSAIKDQQAFLNLWASATPTDAVKIQKKYTRHHLVLKAHKTLLETYGYLKSLYPEESAHNQQAFFDHLCALDFI